MRFTGRFRLVALAAQAAIIGALLWLVIGMGATSTAAADMQIDIQGFAFSPATLTIPAGTKVTWTNKDAATHTVTSDTGAFNSNNLPNGASFSFTFMQAGTFSYKCAIHPRMIASITVTAAGGSTAAGAPAASTAAPGAVLPKTGQAQDRRSTGTLLWLVIGAAAVVMGTGIALRRHARTTSSE
jgi:plastocyanin